MSKPLRITLIVLGAIVVVYVLFTVVFPRLEGFTDDPGLEGEASSLPTVVAAPHGSDPR